MSETDKQDPMDPVEILQSLNDKQDESIATILDLNHDIIRATRQQAKNILTIRKAHLEEADRLYDLAMLLADSIQVTSQIAAGLVDIEFGGDVPKELQDEEEEDEDDE